MTDADDDATVREWVRRWSACVASVDIDEAVKLFDPAVVGFGTRAEVAVGLDQLVEQQWRHVWPAISGFELDADDAHVLLADDRTQAVVATTWTSIGRRRDGSTGHRPGRATVVLRRRDGTPPWLGIHTHFSLTPT